MLRALPLLLVCLLAVAVLAPKAEASTKQWSILEDDTQLHRHLTTTLRDLHALGVTMVKLTVRWNTVAPRPYASRAPKGFKAGTPSSYPGRSWSYLDGVVRTAAQVGIKVGFMVTGPAPVWAEGRGIPAGHAARIGNWEPSASKFGAFVKALGTRYDGRYLPRTSSTALPPVSWWSIWNEPNFGPDLAPQAIDNEHVDSAAFMYRSLLAHAWGALKASGHSPSHGTVLIGETAPRGREGSAFPGKFSGTVPLRFLRSLYCLSQSDRVLTGATARANHCPTRRSAFRAQNPALFKASGFADHPYAQGTPPNLPTYACGATFCSNRRTRRSNPGYADFAELGRLERLLRRLNSTYGVRRSVPIWSTEYGYWTNPPDHAAGSLRPSVAAYYMNWAEYLSYRNPLLRSYSQYLLIDPRSGVFSSGLQLADRKQLATYSAYRMPMYMPVTTARSPRALKVWGGVRPAAYSLVPAAARIEFKPSHRGAWTTVKQVLVRAPGGYFTAKVTFRHSGSVRVAWSPSVGRTDYSRTQAIRVR